MGNGRFVNGKLNFIVTANYILTAAEKTAWQTMLQRASDFLYNATNGQVQFGNVYMIDDNFGLLSAEAIMFQQNAETPGGTYGYFGKPGAAVKFYLNFRGSPPTFVHEMSHHIWNLGDEYSGPMERFRIDRTSAADLYTIPVVVSLVPNSLVNDQVNLLFGGHNYRKKVVSNTANRIVVEADYPALPSTLEFGDIQHMNVSCGMPSITGTNFCIMEDSNTANVLAYCDPSNHDTIQNTDQQVRHQMSCWDKIVATPDFTSLVIPPGTTPALPAAPVNFLDILKENRFVLAFDRSRSMNGSQLEYAKEGIRYWLDSCTLANDFLAIIAYNHSNNLLLPITQGSAIPSVATLQNDIDALTASGNTNIRDALNEGVTQITSIPNLAVNQSIVLLTDGQHNRPLGSRLIEAAPNLVEKGVRVATIAIGEGSDVDAAELDDLAYETGGIFALVGLSNPIDIETALIEANLYLRGSLLNSDSFDFIPSPVVGSTKSKVDRLYKRRKWPTLKDVLDTLQIEPASFTSVRSFAPYSDLFRITTVYVEKGCERLNFSINYPLNTDFDFFLIDPSGQPVPVNNSSVRKVGGRSHKIIAVRQPAVGKWKIILMAKSLQPGNSATTVNLSVGAENRTLVITGGCTRSVYRSNERVRVFATAKWNTGLTGLTVRAKIHSPSGDDAFVNLADGDLLSELSGRYVADIPHLKVGQYKGVISIAAPTRSMKADLRHEVFHSRSGRISVRSSAPRFERQLPFYFEIVKGR